MVTTDVKGQKLAKKVSRPRPDYDFYTTPVADIRKALSYIFSEEDFSIPLMVLDPCAGNGAFAEAINAETTKWDIQQIDIVQREAELTQCGDFLTIKPMPVFDIVIFNPPYLLATEFVERAMQWLDTGGVAVVFAKLDFLAGRKRYKRLFGEFNLSRVIVNVGRVHCKYNGDENDKQKSTTESAWFVFTKERQTNLPTIEWLE